MSTKKREKSQHPLRDNIEVLTFAVVMALALKPFAVEPYQIPTGSMQPTLMGAELVDPKTREPAGGVHDRVLVEKVSFLLRDPKRWEVVVFRYPLATLNNYVKRCVGVEDEELMIRYGDIWTRPLGSTRDFAVQRKSRSLQEALWKQVFPRANDAPEDWSGWGKRQVRMLVDGRIELEGGGSLERKQIRDGYEDGYQPELAGMLRKRAAPSVYPSDLRLAFEAERKSGAGAFAVDLKLAAYDCRVELAAEGRGPHRIELPDGEVEVFDLDLPAGTVAFDIAFWDHHLEVELRSETEVFVKQWDFTMEAAGSKLNHVQLEAPGDDAGWIISPPTLWRDIHYLTPSGETGDESLPVEILPGHYYMLGDNTQHSQDSREWTARVLRLEEPVKGAVELRGDDFRGGSDPFFDNPRWNLDTGGMTGELMTFRDQHGELYQFPTTTIASDTVAPNPLVPREYIIGKAMAVFMPLKLWAPVNRFKLVR